MLGRGRGGLFQEVLQLVLVVGDDGLGSCGEAVQLALLVVQCGVDGGNLGMEWWNLAALLFE